MVGADPAGPGSTGFNIDIRYGQNRGGEDSGAQVTDPVEYVEQILEQAGLYDQMQRIYQNNFNEQK